VTSMPVNTVSLLAPWLIAVVLIAAPTGASTLAIAQDEPQQAAAPANTDAPQQAAAPVQADDPRQPSDPDADEAPSNQWREDLRAEIAGLHSEIAELRAALAKLPAAATAPAPPSPTEAAGRRVRGVGGTLVVASGEIVDRADNLGGPIQVRGVVLGDARAIGGDIHVFDGGAIHGSASTVGGDIRVDPGGKLTGAANVVGGKVIVKPGGKLGAPAGALQPAAAIGGLPQASGWWQTAWDFGASLYQRLVFLLAFAGAGVLVIALMPQRIHYIADQLAERPFLSGFVGVVGTLLAAVASVLLLPTLIGPLLLLSALGIAWMMGFVALCQVVGDRLSLGERRAGRWLAFLAGSVILSFVGALPWIGVLVVLAASLMGVGAVITSRYGAPPQRA